MLTQTFSACRVTPAPLNALQIEHLWLRAHGPAYLKVQMAAIALAESGGRITEWNRADPHGGSFGLWQVNGVHPFSPHRLRHDPAYNARAAVYVYRRQGLGAWGTHSYGKDKAFLPAARWAAEHDARLATRAHHHARKSTHVAHVIAPIPLREPVPLALNHVLFCFLGACALTWAWNSLRLLKNAFGVAIREEVATQRRVARRKRSREEAAFRRRTMPRAKRLALG